MSLVDPECHPELQTSGNLACADCFSDNDLRDWFEKNGEEGFCDYCEEDRSAVADVSDVSRFIAERLSAFYGRAGDQLPYESREGGYQGWHVCTYELLLDEVGLDLPNDKDDALMDEIASQIGDETWCEYDWLSLNYDQSLLYSWDDFARAVSYERRFFFTRLGHDDAGHPDSRSVGEFLTELGALIDRLGTISEIDAGAQYFRARPCDPNAAFETAEDLGPPPREAATQSNRMNPPGIPMFYGSDNADLAVAEVRSAGAVSVGEFRAAKPLRIIDLYDLPEMPGFFSTASREEILGLRFLRKLSQIIAEPVERDDRVHIDYIPTQVIAEFFREYAFAAGPVDGVRYKTALEQAGSNTALFATQDNLVTQTHSESSTRWLRLQNAELTAAQRTED